MSFTTRRQVACVVSAVFSLMNTGIPTVQAASSQVEIASVTSTGQLGDQSVGFSCDDIRPQISGDGRFVAFSSAARNLRSAPREFFAVDYIYVRDRSARKTILVSVPTIALPDQKQRSSCNPRISRNGRYVLFDSKSEVMVANDKYAGSDCFFRDLSQNRTAIISVSSTGAQGNGDCVASSITSTGRFILFSSKATNLVNGDTNGKADLFLRDTQTSTTTRVSVGSGGVQGKGVSDIGIASADGRYVAFQSTSNNLVSGFTGNGVYLLDRSTARVIGLNKYDGKVFAAKLGAMSDDGRYIGINGWYGYAYLFDRQSGRLSPLLSIGGKNPKSVVITGVSADGRFISFTSGEANLTTDDRNGKLDSFVFDRNSNSIRLTSITPSRAQATRTGSESGGISNNGNITPFWSREDFVGGDTNGYSDTFVSVK